MNAQVKEASDMERFLVSKCDFVKQNVHKAHTINSNTSIAYSWYSVQLVY